MSDTRLEARIARLIDAIERLVDSIALDRTECAHCHKVGLRLDEQLTQASQGSARVGDCPACRARTFQPKVRP